MAVSQTEDLTALKTVLTRHRNLFSKIQGIPEKDSRAADITRCKNDGTAGQKRRSKNQNDPARFIKSISITEEGEIADRNIYDLDLCRLSEEEKYDGFYAVITNLEGDVGKILKINRQRWKIEENFRILKTDFEACPVYVRRENRIKAHFLTCYISLLVYRLLEKKWETNIPVTKFYAPFVPCR